MIKQHRLRFHPIRLIITLAVVAMVTILTIWNNVRISNKLANSAELISYKSIGKLADAIADNISTGIKNHENSISSLANILSHVESEESRVSYINEFAASAPEVTYGIADMAGHLRITKSGAVINVKNEDFFIRCARQGTPVTTTTDVLPLPGGRKTSIVIARSLVIPGSGKMSSIICGFISPESIVNAYKFDTGIAQVLLTDNYDNVLTCTQYDSEYRNLASLEDIITDPGLSDKLVPLDNSSSENVFSYTEKNFTRYIYHTYNVFSNWSLYTSVVINPVYRDTRYDSAYLAFSNILFVIAIMAAILVYMIPTIREARSQRVAESESMMLAKLSHELKTPLNTIMGVSEILSKSNLKSGQLREMSYIYEAGNNMLAMINDILDMSKIEAGKFKLAEEEYEFESVIYDLATIASVRLNDKPVEFITYVSPKVPRYMIGDMLRVRQLLSNIVTNAVKYTNEGYIMISIDCEYINQASLNLIVSVKDTGIGITKENINHLFDSYARFDSKNNSKVEGTGLGMTIVKQFVDLMHGNITVNSEYGKGSEFIVTIMQRLAKTETLIPAYEPEKPYKEMLILEDSPILRDYYSKCLDSARVNYSIASDNYEFTRLLSERGYDFILADHAAASMLAEEESVPESSRIITLIYDHTELIDEEQTIFVPLFSLQIYPYLTNAKKNYAKNYGIGTSFFIHTMPDARVLIVDDNYMNLQVAAAVMKPYKMRVDCAKSGEKALEMIQSADYDLVFMDHMMPGMDGEETLRAIRKLKDHKYKTLPVIALTANASRGAKDEFIKMGFQDFLPKPLEMRALNSKLVAWLKPPKDSPLVEYRVSDDDAGKDAARNGDESQGEIDFSEGLDRIGSLPIYIKTLTNFSKTLVQKKETIKNAFPGDMKAFVIEVHGLKGVAAMVSANKLAKLSLELEDLGRENEAGKIASMLDGYLDYLDTVRECAEKIIDEHK